MPSPSGSTSSSLPRRPRAAPPARSTSCSSRARSAPPSRPRRSPGCEPSRGAWSTIGACATAGGIQAIRNWFDHDDIPSRGLPRARLRRVAGAWPARWPTSWPSTATCVAARSRRPSCASSSSRWSPADEPQLPDEAVCLECKRRGIVCVAVARGIPCLGPVTRTGCGAICPAYGRGCYGCFGPRESANSDLARRLVLRRPLGRRGEPACSPASPPGRARSGRSIDAHGGPPGPGKPAPETARCMTRSHRPARAAT